MAQQWGNQQKPFTPGPQGKQSKVLGPEPAMERMRRYTEQNEQRQRQQAADHQKTKPVIEKTVEQPNFKKVERVFEKPTDAPKVGEPKPAQTNEREGAKEEATMRVKQRRERVFELQGDSVFTQALNDAGGAMAARKNERNREIVAKKQAELDQKHRQKQEQKGQGQSL